MKPRRIELLAPAKNADIAIDAVKCGADAVYMGASKFGARAAAGNDISEIARAIEFAHLFNAKIYVTVNTILYEQELKDVERLIRELYKIGTDALIVQDMGILRLDIPPIQLHASTQCDTRTVEKAKFLEAVGFSQIVLARELSAKEISDIHDNVSMPLECFIHGALCVSYSGRCHASCAIKGRSANRGECAQICRLAYDMIDNKGNVIMKGKHLLSLRDFNQSDRLEELLDAGASSFKIEGRLKESAYVKNVTAYYHQRLNDICRKHPDKYVRGAVGQVSLDFEPCLEKSFNRGFTHYFFDRRQPAEPMASFDTPKSIGEFIGTVKETKGNRITVNGHKQLSNGDGLVYFNNRRELCGFRANKTEGNTIVPLEKIFLPEGTQLYRNFDQTFTALLAKDSATRKLAVDIRIMGLSDGISTEMTDETGHRVTLRTPLELIPAKTNQEEARVKAFGKLGDTHFTLRSFDAGNTADLFIPASTMTAIRRELCELLENDIRATYHFEYRRNEDKTVAAPASLSFADNVANSKAETFYREHETKTIEPAMEVSARKNDNDVLMTTRYCIRREMDCCLKGKNAGRLDRNITLVSGEVRLAVEFDCKNCQMLLRRAK